MGIQVGDRLPELQLQVAKPGGIEGVSTKDLFAGKKVVLFAVPGAFTPTCSLKHLPGSSRRPPRSVRRASTASSAWRSTTPL